MRGELWPTGRWRTRPYPWARTSPLHSCSLLWKLEVCASRFPFSVNTPGSVVYDERRAVSSYSVLSLHLPSQDLRLGVGLSQIQGLLGAALPGPEASRRDWGPTPGCWEASRGGSGLHTEFGRRQGGGLYLRDSAVSEGPLSHDMCHERRPGQVPKGWPSGPCGEWSCAFPQDGFRSLGLVSEACVGDHLGSAARQLSPSPGSPKVGGHP